MEKGNVQAFFWFVRDEFMGTSMLVLGLRVFSIPSKEREMVYIAGWEHVTKMDRDKRWIMIFFMVKNTKGIKWQDQGLVDLHVNEYIPLMMVLTLFVSLSLCLYLYNEIVCIAWNYYQGKKRENVDNIV